MEEDFVYDYRQYQEDCEDALLKDILSDKDCHPVIAVPTGGGKTKIIGGVIYKYLELNPTHNILIVSHTETIIKQDYEAIKIFFPGIYIGLYSSGLDSRSIEKITVAGIQSIYKKGDLFKDIDLCIVDECHTVPTKGNGMYRQFFNSIDVIRAGCSGSPFRTGHGYVHKGRGALFNKLSYDLCTLDKFNQLIEDGYLTKLYSKPPELQLDTDGVKESAGDYNLKHLSEKFDRDSITNAAIKELILLGKNYNSWLVFAIDIQHADRINEKLINSGILSTVLHSRSNGDRHQIKDDFVNKRIRALVSVGMITTGFDAPNIDLIVLLRPTKSPVLHVQMIGRGLRICEGKTHCLVLDFSGNIMRLGPINNVEVPIKGKKKGTGRPIVKTCPDCGCLHHPTLKICDVCGHTFVFKENLKTTHSENEVIQKTSEKKWLKVTNIYYRIHSKMGKPDSLRVIYMCGLYSLNEYICFNHVGYAKYKADNWVKFRWNLDRLPPDVSILHQYSKYLRQPSEILIDTNAKYPIILDNKFA
jgi:DNA repair protein RadD